MNVFGIGLPEMVVIAAVGLLVFGPKRLPELGKTLGRTLKGFQSASQEFEKELKAAVAAPVESAPLAASSAVSDSAESDVAEPALQEASAQTPQPPAAAPVDSPVG